MGSSEISLVFGDKIARLPASVALSLVWAATAQAAPADKHEDDRSEAIVVYGRAIAQIGTAQSGSQGTVGYRDFEDKPLSRTGELFENVPGVIATQHSGTGKANQFFLRGFNLDHGTDLAGFVDGVPINMRSHGHGQGYLDVNFLIPELVERIDYRKGPYFADVGDFSAAGTIQVHTANKLDHPIVEGTVGSYGYYRSLTAASLPVGRGDLLIALDGTLSNGPWVLDEKLRKINGAIKYSVGDGDRTFSLGLTGYRATWQATDQVPRRAIESGAIGRFGNLDPDLGGQTTRIGLTANATIGQTTLTAYAIHYNFGLTSNFTYFLEDPIDGDEFQQRDRRQVYGGTLRHQVEANVAGIPLDITVGADGRYDDIGKVGLYRSVDGRISSTVREDKVGEFSTALFASAQMHLASTLRLTLGLRGDYYHYDVNSSLRVNSGKGDDAILAPKVALAWQPIDHVELYADYGESFHSNDVRGAAITVDPVTGDPIDSVPVLVRARGGEIGGRLETGRLTASAAVFYLDLASELVFVGDAGSTEPNNASHRLGAEATVFWRATEWLTIDGSLAATRGRFKNVPRGQSRIPGAIENVVAAGAAAQFGHGLSGSVRLRHFGAAPLIEDNSQRSEPTTLVNLGLYYRVGPARFGIDALNVLASKDNDITYFYASRLPGEPAEGVEDEHLHPVEPRQVRASVRVEF